MQIGEHLYHEIIDALPEHIAVIDCSGRIRVVNRAWDIFAAENGAANNPCVGVGANYLEVCRRSTESGDEYAERALKTITMILGGRLPSAVMDYPCHSPTEQRWFAMCVVGFRSLGAAGAVVSHSNVTRRTVAAKEVSHRSKNLLSLVQSIARRTIKHDPEGIAQLSERLRSLTKTQDLLCGYDWASVPMGELVRLELEHFSDLLGGRIQVGGPAILINPRAAQAIGMALHELGTNAAKYGALANSSGRVLLNWTVAPTSSSDQFTLSWVERDGLSVTKPVLQGFGSLVTVEAMELALKAKVAVDYDVKGFSWSVTCPLENIVEL